MDDLIMEERRKKVKALYYFERMLALDDKHFQFVLLGELVEVTDLLSGSVQYVNVACDNVPAMMYDILKQAGDWIL